MNARLEIAKRQIWEKGIHRYLRTKWFIQIAREIMDTVTQEEVIEAYIEILNERVQDRN